jgi:superfamily II DNA or RNA helicase
MDSVDVRVVSEDAAFMRVMADNSTLRILSDQFKFRIPNAQFHPKVKARMWDGYIRLLNTMTGRMYRGLLRDLERVCADEGFTIDVDSDLLGESTHSAEDAAAWARTIGLPADRVPHGYQIEALLHVISNHNGLIISPTGSGKSLVAYLIARWFNLKTLVVVPAIHLATQMQGDFVSYGCDEDDIHLIYAGQEKSADVPFTISTWQSLYKLDHEYFDQYDVVIADEVHLFSSKELTAMMERMANTYFRIGLTGTLDGSQTNEMVLTGLFGPKFQTTTTKALIDSGVLTKPQIYVMQLSHKSADVRLPKSAKYPDEVSYICKSESRNRLITNLVKSLKGNTLVLFNYVDKHGKVLYKMGVDEIGDPSKVHLIYGKVDREDREQIRQIIEGSDDNVLYASYKTLSTGVNQPNLHNLVFASPSKGIVRVCQSIGRGLRRHDSKDVFKIYDLADNFRYGTDHMMERLAIYEAQEFDYKIIKLDI